MKRKEKIFSITKSDLKIDVFRAGGKGGQNQNKVNSGVRITHAPSGAVGEARDSRDQHLNKKQAFIRMTNTEEFKSWMALQKEIILGNIVLEEKNSSGEWEDKTLEPGK